MKELKFLKWEMIWVWLKKVIYSNQFNPFLLDFCLTPSMSTSGNFDYWILTGILSVMFSCLLFEQNPRGPEWEEAVLDYGWMDWIVNITFESHLESAQFALCKLQFSCDWMPIYIQPIFLRCLLEQIEQSFTNTGAVQLDCRASMPNGIQGWLANVCQKGLMLNCTSGPQFNHRWSWLAVLPSFPIPLFDYQFNFYWFHLYLGSQHSLYWLVVFHRVLHKPSHSPLPACLVLFLCIYSCFSVVHSVYQLFFLVSHFLLPLFTPGFSPETSVDVQFLCVFHFFI